MTTIELERPGRGDLIAGISVAIVLIPQSLAYAEIAGLPAFPSSKGGPLKQSPIGGSHILYKQLSTLPEEAAMGLLGLAIGR